MPIYLRGRKIYFDTGTWYKDSQDLQTQKSWVQRSFRDQKRIHNPVKYLR